MLTAQTILAYVEKEWRDNPKFNVFFSSVFLDLIRVIPNLKDPPECFSLEMAPGIPLAKFILEAYMAQEKQPQWQRLRQEAISCGLI